MSRSGATPGKSRGLSLLLEANKQTWRSAALRDCREWQATEGGKQYTGLGAGAQAKKFKYSYKDGSGQAGLRGDRRCFQSARGDWAICCNSEVIELTEGKHRKKELSTSAEWAGGKYRLALFYYSILPTYIVFSLFWKLIIHILIKADFLSSKFCDFLGAACNKKVLCTSFQSCSWLRVLSRREENGINSKWKWVELKGGIFGGKR